MKKYQKSDSVSYTLGAFPSIELISQRPHDVVVVYQSSRYDRQEDLKKLCQKQNVSLETNDKAIEKLSDKENVFVIALFRKTTAVLSQGHHVVLVHPENMGNFGTIVRTVAGFGLKDLAVITPAIDFFDPKTVRASMGSFFHVNIQPFASFEDYARAYPSHHLFPFMLQSTQYLDDFRFPGGPSSLVFGPESSGLSDDFARFGQALKIRQNPCVDSFNLPTAVAVAVYEFTRQIR